MSEKQAHLVGNSKQATLIIKEILPALESIILNANREFFTVREAMRVLSISRTQLYYLRVRGLLDSKRVGRRVYITREAIHKLVMSNGEVQVASLTKTSLTKTS
ncbi:MAG TPA: helix-turn-helix domain-containing protein [Cyclobacteriaceae bacterium]|nr:helix-turn-helix domain-containing protein [Cyclobacteriaceae bacterium]